MKTHLKNEKGFTIVELIVSLGIFALMTALLLSKYGNFNQGILLNNLAYDVALTIRNAQSYGLNVKSAKRSEDQFGSPYGVHFVANTANFIFFADTNKDGVYSSVDSEVYPTIIKRGSKVSALCIGTGNACTSSNNATDLSISFIRPDPNAKILANSGAISGNYAEIILSATDGTTKKVIVRSTGQIAVQN